MCKYCEICNLPEELQFCIKCNDGFHSDCLKKAYYPKKSCKKRKAWVCQKCFECAICESKYIYYDKKLYNKLFNYDFNTCFKCYDKYQLERPVKCCSKYLNASLFDNTTGRLIAKPEENVIQCDKCKDWTHFACNNLSDEDVEFVQNFKLQFAGSFQFVCKFCDEQSIDLKQRLNELKWKSKLNANKKKKKA